MPTSPILPTLPPIRNSVIAKQIFIHRSYVNEHPEVTESNERLEFLGDAVLELCTSSYLFQEFPTEPEGVLTNLRSSLVKTTTLARVARELKISTSILLSKGEDQTNAREHDSILADTFEAYLGGLYLDQGYSAVDRFLHLHLFPLLEDIRAKNMEKDAKSKFQELIQGTQKELPVYTVVSTTGPDHNKRFTVSVSVGGKVIATAEGASKQEAQQETATKALEIWTKA